MSLERLREFRQKFDGHLLDYPPKQPIKVGTQRPVYVTDNDADARAAAEQARWNMRVTLSLRHNYSRVENGHAIAVPFDNEPTTDDILDKFSVIGTPDTCIRQIQRLQEAMGIDHFNCSFYFGDLKQSKVLRSMRLFAEEVMPAFRTLTAETTAVLLRMAEPFWPGLLADLRDTRGDRARRGDLSGLRPGRPTP